MGSAVGTAVGASVGLSVGVGACVASGSGSPSASGVAVGFGQVIPLRPWLRFTAKPSTVNLVVSLVPSTSIVTVRVATVLQVAVNRAACAR